MIVLVTGTRTGIGRWLAEYLVGRGHVVLGCSRRPPSGMPKGYHHYEADLTDGETVKAMFHAIAKAHHHIDAVVNNAGTARMAPFMLTDADDIRAIFALNVFAVMQCCREAVKLLRHSRQETTSILNLSSVAALFSLEGQLAYAASKAAIEQMTRSLSREVAAMNIRVNTIGLPPIKTALTRSVEKEKIDALVARQAIRRACEFADLAGPVEFFLSDAACFVTGETLYLGGVR
jgi:3-oxoacyl-[acyl-carrier protein] reductase